MLTVQNDLKKITIALKIVHFRKYSADFLKTFLQFYKDFGNYFRVGQYRRPRRLCRYTPGYLWPVKSA